MRKLSFGHKFAIHCTLHSEAQNTEKNIQNDNRNSSNDCYTITIHPDFHDQVYGYRMGCTKLLQCQHFRANAEIMELIAIVQLFKATEKEVSHNILPSWNEKAKTMEMTAIVNVNSMRVNQLSNDYFWNNLWVRRYTRFRTSSFSINSFFAHLLSFWSSDKTPNTSNIHANECSCLMWCVVL